MVEEQVRVEVGRHVHARAVVHPAFGRELAHPGVNEGHAGVPGFPGFPVGGIVFPLDEGEFEIAGEVHGGVGRGEEGLAIEFAEDELADPGVDSGFGGGFGEVGGVGVLFHDGGAGLAHGEDASGEVRGQAGGGVFARVGAGFGVFGEVVSEEVVEAGDGGGVAGGPEFADAVAVGGGGKFFFLWGCGDRGAVEELRDLLFGRSAVLGGRGDGVKEGWVALDCG